MSERRFGRVRIDLDTMWDILNDPMSVSVIDNDVPKDACIVGLSWDIASNSVVIYLESKSFDVLPAGAIPLWLHGPKYEWSGLKG